MIDVSALTIKYTGRKRPILRDLSLQVPQGQTLLILGASGSGKSSLALTFNGLIPHSIGEVLAGQVHVAGADTQQTSVAQLAQRVGILFQDPDAQFATLTVEDEIVFGLENLCLDPAQMEARLETALSQVGMLHTRHRPVYALSGGEKQRIALAALLAMQPEVLVFDEPTANLDSVGTQQVFALLAQLKARGQHTLILIEHKLDELMHLVDRVLVLDSEGQIFADGAPREIFDRYAAELQEMGVWTPQVCMLAHELRLAGHVLPSFPVTIGEAVKVLAPLLAAHPALSASSAPPAGASPRSSVYSIRDLSFHYGDIPALHNVSMEISQGDFLAIVGPNGAGKSTLARHLIGLLDPPVGKVFLNGRDIHALDARRLAEQVAYVFQNPEHQFVTERVEDEVAYGLRVAGLDETLVAEQSRQLLDTFGLARYARANPFTLSHGEKRRLSVAAMLAVGQQTLILDEPTFGQDERNAAALMALLRALNAQGKTIIMITHDMRLVAEAADKVAVILEGRLEFFGQPAALFAQEDLLARAHLNLPPLARLAALMATQYPHMQGWSTLQDYQTLTQMVRV
ncbi:MAG: ABC transporter ATP-binding protein [Anaerolineales bacterium]|nr:ABC transporter ATP-binding protein [Anaerolineales bacterium]MCW5855657.1 ABC transporter ATP-binding protein [Anaerolineales bacterium]